MKKTTRWCILQASAPKFYGMPKTYKKKVPLRSIVSSIGFVTYGVAMELAQILKSLVVNPYTMLTTVKNLQNLQMKSETPN